MGAQIEFTARACALVITATTTGQMLPTQAQPPRPLPAQPPQARPPRPLPAQAGNPVSLPPGGALPATHPQQSRVAQENPTQSC